MPLDRRTALGRMALAVAAGAAAGCSRKPPPAQPVPAGASVLALGDSLTFGTGAQPHESYPAVLARTSGWQVHNAGVSGDTSAQGLARLPALLQEHRPALLLLGLGGNDLLRRLPQEQLKDNLARAVALGREAGAQVLLIAVPKPSLAAVAAGSLTDHPLYGELAQAQNLVLQRQGWAEVLAREEWRSDSIHANAAGYAEFAARLLATARAAGLHIHTQP